MKPEVVFQCIKDELENYSVSDIFDELGDENPVGEILNALSFMDKEHNQVLEISFYQLNKLVEKFKNNEIEPFDFYHYLCVANVVYYYSESCGISTDLLAHMFFTSQENKFFFEENEENIDFDNVVYNLCERIKICNDISLKGLVQKYGDLRVLEFLLKGKNLPFDVKEIKKLFFKYIEEDAPYILIETIEKYLNNEIREIFRYEDILKLIHKALNSEYIISWEDSFIRKIRDHYLIVLEDGDEEGNRDLERLYKECISYSLQYDSIYGKYKIADFYEKGLLVPKDLFLAEGILESLIPDALDVYNRDKNIAYKIASLYGTILVNKDDETSKKFGIYYLELSNYLINLNRISRDLNEHEKHIFNKNSGLLKGFYTNNVNSMANGNLETLIIANDLNKDSIGKDFVLEYNDTNVLGKLISFDYDGDLNKPILRFLVMKEQELFFFLGHEIIIDGYNLPSNLRRLKSLKKCDKSFLSDGFKAVKNYPELLSKICMFTIDGNIDYIFDSVSIISFEIEDPTVNLGKGELRFMITYSDSMRKKKIIREFVLSCEMISNSSSNYRSSETNNLSCKLLKDEILLNFEIEENKEYLFKIFSACYREYKLNK